PNKNDHVFLSYEWQSKTSVDADEYTPRPDIEGGVVPNALTSKGEIWKVTVKVTDGVEFAVDEAGAVAGVDAEAAIGNSIPQAVNVQITPNTGVDTVGRLIASAGSEDIDEDIVSLDYAWMVNGSQVDVDGTELDGAFFAKGDEVWVEVTPNDGESSGDIVASNKVTITNTAPSITGVEIDPGEAFEGTTLGCNPIGWFDLDDDEAALDISWMVNGVDVGTSVTLDGSKFNKHNIVRCVGVPNDGDDVGARQVSGPIEVMNTAPSIGAVTLSDNTPKAIDELTAIIDGAHDDDSDELTYTYEWYVDEVMVSTDAALARLSFIKGQEVWVVVIPHDDEEAGEPVKSDVGTSVNSEPIIDSITLRPNPAYTDSTLSAAVVAYDADGDRISYERTWTVGGTAITEVGPTIDGETWFERGDDVFLEIVPSDDDAKGKKVKSDTLTVANSLPTDPVISIDPEKPNDSFDLWCVIDEESTDADEDDLTVTVTWKRNGTDFTDTDYTDIAGDTVLAKHTVDGDEWECTVSVDDGLDTISVSSTVEVLNWAGPRNFTTCGKTGYSGPSQSQCDGAYSKGTLADDKLLVSGGIQTWTAPTSGDFIIEAWGAQGGQGTYGSYSGAKGARMRGTFALSEGDKIKVIVGQRGLGSSYRAGGGGGSFVIKADGTPLLVAAGGGGNGYRYYSAESCGGQSGTTPKKGVDGFGRSCTSYSTSSGYGGSYYYKYQSGYYYYWYYYGGGGAGVKGDGNHYQSYMKSKSFNSGGNGGNGNYADGGFGGGGAGDSYYRYRPYYSSYTYGPYSYSYGSGGGGGYTGGHAGRQQGGGGASFNGGSDKSDTSNTQTGAGKVSIDLK
ncbi:MAG: hypothetical protein ACI9MC_001976, partial [Kiritimatiellia bacterium]